MVEKPADEDPRTDEVELLIGWLPSKERDAELSLRAGLPTLMPGLLYADQVNVLCPMSDDFFEMDDFSAVNRSVRDRYELWACDGGYPVDEDDPSAGVEPLVPEVWIEHAQRYVDEARAGIENGDPMVTAEALVKYKVLSWGAHGYGGPEVLKHHLPDLDEKWVETAGQVGSRAYNEAEAALLRETFLALADQPGIYPLLDDPSGALVTTPRDGNEALGRWARTRGAEGTLAVELLRRLPSPRSDTPWDAVVDVRDSLDEPLARFRRALATSASEAAPEDPFSEDFVEFTTHVWRTEAVPALDELDELTRSASLRQVFFDDVLSDLSTYAGPTIGLVSALSSSVPAIASATLAVATPALRTIAHKRARAKEVSGHDFLFLHGARQAFTRID